MSLKTFFVKYASGVRDIIHSDLESIESFCNTHFGSAWEDAKAFGAHIAMTEHNLEANLRGDYDHMFAPAEAPSASEGGSAPAPSPSPAPSATAPAPAPTGAPAPAPSTGEQPSTDPTGAAPTGDVHVGLTGAEATTETGGTQ